MKFVSPCNWFSGYFCDFVTAMWSSPLPVTVELILFACGLEAVHVRCTFCTNAELFVLFAV